MSKAIVKKTAICLRSTGGFSEFLMDSIENVDKELSTTNIPKSYSSEVNLISDGISKRKLIKMNEPLRYNGYTFYQSSFIEGEINDISVLAVVKNYGRLFPYISSCIICLGLLIH